MSNIQVQVIRTPGRDRFFDECIKSLGGEDVEVSVDRFGPHLQTRLNFINTAVRDYVAFVDDDDLVVPGVFIKLRSLIENADQERVVGAYSHEQLISADGDVLRTPIKYNVPFNLDTSLTYFHFPRVQLLRTDVAQKVSRFLNEQPENVQRYLYPEFTIMTLAGLVGDWLELPEIGYLYRKHTGNMINTLPHLWYKNQTRQLVRGVANSLNK